MSRGVRFVSFNVNGRTNPIKRNRIEVVYLQETHLNSDEHKKLRRMGFTNLFSSSYKSGRRRGVAIFISKNLNFEMKDKEGRFVLVQGSIDGNLVTLMNVYAPPGSDLDFFKKIINMMLTQTQGFLICGGDLNIRPRPELDSSNRKVPESNTLYKKVTMLFQKVDLIDIWRELFPTRRDYSHYSAPHSLYTRIDFHNFC
uniref:exodeoxyribonuclease III n=1 Tax=Gouania willdenowi TaxID=441366 RepID=A0A8C5G012_GOUWI